MPKAKPIAHLEALLGFGSLKRAGPLVTTDKRPRRKMVSGAWRVAGLSPQALHSNL